MGLSGTSKGVTMAQKSKAMSMIIDQVCTLACSWSITHDL